MQEENFFHIRFLFKAAVTVSYCHTDFCKYDFIFCGIYEEVISPQSTVGSRAGAKPVGGWRSTVGCHKSSWCSNSEPRIHFQYNSIF